MKNLKILQKEVEDPPEYEYAFEYGIENDCFFAIVA
jgi:hypothetical protein